MSFLLAYFNFNFNIFVYGSWICIFFYQYIWKRFCCHATARAHYQRDMNTYYVSVYLMYALLHLFVFTSRQHRLNSLYTVITETFGRKYIRNALPCAKIIKIGFFSTELFWIKSTYFFWDSVYIERNFMLRFVLIGKIKPETEREFIDWW